MRPLIWPLPGRHMDWAGHSPVTTATQVVTGRAAGPDSRMVGAENEEIQ